MNEIISLLSRENMPVIFKINNLPLTEQERTFHAVSSDGLIFIKSEAEIADIRSSEGCDHWDALTSFPGYSQIEAAKYLSQLCRGAEVEVIEA